MKLLSCFLPKIEDVAEDFIAFLERDLDENRVNKTDLLTSVYQYAFEAITRIALDTR